MKNLKHQNIIRSFDIRPNAVYRKKNDKISCSAILLEYAQGGEFFDIINWTEKFSGRLARTYFEEIIKGLDYMHEEGYAHLDIKT